MGLREESHVMSCPLYHDRRTTPGCVAIVVASGHAMRVYVHGAFDARRYVLRIGSSDVMLINTGNGLEGRRATDTLDVRGMRIVMLMGIEPRELLMAGAGLFV